LTGLLGFAIIELEAPTGLLKNFMISKITAFFKEVRLETKRVNWPTRTQIFNYTLIVLGISGAVAVFLGGIDFILTTILNRFIL